MKGVSRLLKTKLTARAVDDASDVQCVFGDISAPFMLVGVRWNSVEERMNPLREEWIKTLRFPPYYPKTVRMNKYDHVTPFLHTVTIPHHHRAHMFVSKKEVLHLCNMV